MLPSFHTKYIYAEDRRFHDFTGTWGEKAGYVYDGIITTLELD
jgi:hypothetical protein